MAGSTPKKLVDIDNPSNYKKTQKKKYEIYACLPRIGTPVFNKLEKSNYVVDAARRVVLSGTVGELWVIDIAKLASTYTIGGRPITEEVLKSKMIEVSTEIAGKTETVIDWFKVETKAGFEPYYAVHVPNNMQGAVMTSWGSCLQYNAPGIGHSKGDYIVCTAFPNGMPNINDRWVVNGELFPRTYDMRAFSGAGTQRQLHAEAPLPTSLIDRRRIMQGEKTVSKGDTISALMASSNVKETSANRHLVETMIKFAQQVNNAHQTGRVKYGIQANKFPLFSDIEGNGMECRFDYDIIINGASHNAFVERYTNGRVIFCGWIDNSGDPTERSININSMASELPKIHNTFYKKVTGQ